MCGLKHSIDPSVQVMYQNNLLKKAVFLSFDHISVQLKLNSFTKIIIIQFSSIEYINNNLYIILFLNCPFYTIEWVMKILVHFHI